MDDDDQLAEHLDERQAAAEPDGDVDAGVDEFPRGAYVAIVPIPWGVVTAYAVGDLVPYDSIVEHGWQQLVRPAATESPAQPVQDGGADGG